MDELPISQQDQRRRRAMITFQVVCYGYLLVMFCIQLWMWSVRDW